MTGSGEEIEIRLADPPPCPRCGEGALLAVSYPHRWRDARGEELAGLREAVLCPGCDRGQGEASGLLQLFNVEGRVDFANMARFAELAALWVASVRSLTLDEARLAEEHALWRRGEL
ncbi:DUF6300 family protein [Streptomyces sp. NPDC055897]